jgi:hypothetical protein
MYYFRVVHYVFNPDHYFGIVIANTTLFYNYYTSIIIFYIKINSIVLLFFQAYVEKLTSPVNSFQLFDRHFQASKVRDLKFLCLSQLHDLKDRIIKVGI